MNGTWMVVMLGAALWSAIAAPEPVPFKTLASGNQSDIERPRDAVARTAVEWKGLCAAHAGGRTCPQADLSTSTVIGIFLGTRPSAGYSVEITGIQRDGDALVVTYREKKPGPDVMAAQMITMPFQIVTVDRFTGPIRFVHAR